jgi:hypothetical protein
MWTAQTCEEGEGDVKFAYADPPYVGCARYYKDHPDYGGEVDHKDLIQRLSLEFPDGWALSCHAPSLSHLLPMCPGGVRTMAWVKPFCSFKPGVGVAYAWEPVIVMGGRKRDKSQPTVRDWVSCNITLKKGLVGAKPRDFCFWLFSVLNVVPGDDFVDMFPGSGAVAKHLQSYLSYYDESIKVEQGLLPLGGLSDADND